MNKMLVDCNGHRDMCHQVRPVRRAKSDLVYVSSWGAVQSVFSFVDQHDFTVNIYANILT